MDTGSDTTDARRTRWGVIGTGDIARRTAADLRATENVDVVGVAARSSGSASAFAAEFRILRAFESVEALLAAPDIDVVYICTPHSSHFAIASAALQAGKHVLCEKSFTLTAAEARTLAAEASTRGLFLMEAMWMRFNPSIRRLVELLAEGVIGEVRSVHADFSWPFPEDPDGRFWNASLGGGALLDLGVYPLTIAHLLLGAPTTVRAHGLITADGVDVRSGVYLEDAGGRFAQLSTSMREVLPAAATIGGSEGYIRIDSPFYSSGTFWVHRLPDLKPEGVYTSVEGDGYVHMFRAVSEAVLRGLTEHPLNPLSATIEVLDTMDAVRAELLAERTAEPA